MTHLRQIIGTDGGSLAYWCQGCDDAHVIQVGHGAGPRWDWDGSHDAPTFSPSVLCRSGKRVCHTFVRGGMVEFLGDCTHDFAGQTLPIPPWPYADGEYGGVEPLLPSDTQQIDGGEVMTDEQFLALELWVLSMVNLPGGGDRALDLCDVRRARAKALLVAPQPSKQDGDEE